MCFTTRHPGSHCVFLPYNDIVLVVIDQFIDRNATESVTLVASIAQPARRKVKLMRASSSVSAADDEGETHENVLDLNDITVPRI